MPFISITRLKVKSIVNLFAFWRANESSLKQLVVTNGFISGKELVDKHLTFWTLTMWENENAMRAFRNASAHKKAMQKLPYWCSEASYFHWDQTEADFPDWASASEKLFNQGKLTKVRNPSPNQLANQFPLIKRTKFERILTKHIV